MTRLGLVLATTGTGGTERYVLRLLRWLPPEVRTTMFVRTDTAGDLHQDFVDAGAEVVYCPLGYADPLRLLRFIHRMRQAQLDVLVDLTGIFGGLPLTVARLLGIRRRITFHRRSTYAFRQDLPRRLFSRATCALVEHSATHILSNSRAALDLFHPRLVDRDPRLAVLPNPIDRGELKARRPREATRRQLGLDEGDIAVLHVGRVDPAKDHTTLLAALARAMTQNRRIRGVLAGPGTETLMARGALVPRSLRDRFRFLGARTDIGELHRASDLFVFTSVTEGQPNALLEAMLSGLPVIASDIPPIREVVPLSAHELLVRPGDVTGFADAILECAADPAARHSRCHDAEVAALTAPETILPCLFDLILPGT